MKLIDFGIKKMKKSDILFFSISIFILVLVIIDACSLFLNHFFLWKRSFGQSIFLDSILFITYLNLNLSTWFKKYNIDIKNYNSHLYFAFDMIVLLTSYIISSLFSVHLLLMFLGNSETLWWNINMYFTIILDILFLTTCTSLFFFINRKYARKY